MRQKRRSVNSGEEAREVNEKVSYGSEKLLSAAVNSLFFLTALFIFSSFFSIAVSQTSLSISVVLWASLMIRSESYRPAWTILDIPFLMFITATLIAVALSDDPASSLKATKNHLLISVVYLIGFSLRGSKRRKILFYVFVAAAAASAVYGVISFINQTGGGGLKRSEGSFSMPLTFGGITMLSSSMLVALALGKGLRKWSRLVVATAALLCLAALFLSFTRSSWMAMIVAFVIIIISMRKWLLIPFFALLTLLFLMLPDSSKERVKSIWDPDYPSNRQRLELLAGGSEIFLENPLFGVGPGDLAKEYAEHLPSGAVFVHGHMHNIFLHIAVTRGVLGLASFIWLIIALYRLFISNLRLALPPPERAWVVGSLAALSGFIVNGLFEWNFGDAEVVTVLYMIVGSNLLLKREGGTVEKRENN